MIVRNQLRWAGHVGTMSDSHLSKQILYSEQSMGSQRKGFKDILHSSQKECYIKSQMWETQALDRDAWNSAVHQGVNLLEDPPTRPERVQKSCQENPPSLSRSRSSMHSV